MRKLGLVILVTAFLQLAYGENEGRKIAERADQNNRGFGGELVKTTLYLINANQDTVVRKMTSKTMERENSEDYSIIQFLDPPDVKGTGLLTYQDPAGDDKQWLYLPELRRVKKITSKNKSGAFMGSEFSYEDITSNALDKFTYKKLGEETINGKECYVVEKYPKYKNSGYVSIKMFITKDDFLPERMEYIDRKNTLYKVQTFGTWKKYGSQTWRSNKIQMENVQTKKKSLLAFSDRVLNQKYNEAEFTQRALQRLVD